MNYEKYPEDLDPTINVLLGNRYMIKTDISNCFPSMYSHALSWALVGKSEAKKCKTKKNGTIY